MADAAVHGHDDHHDQRGFFTRWFMSTNHKDIGVLYLFTAGVVGLISVCFTVYMRMELQHPGVQYMCLEGARLIAAGADEVCTPNGHLWNVMITYHGVLMMFFVVIPALFGGFGNYFMPLHIGAPDMAFPRLNNLSYWMYVCGVALGSSTFHSSWRGVAPKAMAASTNDCGVELMPRCVSRIGAGSTKITVAISPGTMPMPKNTMAGIR